MLAAAIRCQAGVIVTYNLKDFPQAVLAGHGMEAQHPDDFVSHLHDLAPAAVCAAVRGQREALKNPPRSVRELLDTFLAQRGFVWVIFRVLGTLRSVGIGYFIVPGSWGKGSGLLNGRKCR